MTNVYVIIREKWRGRGETTGDRREEKMTNDIKGEVKGPNTRRMGYGALVCWMGLVTWEEFGRFTCDTVWLGLQCKTLA